MAELKPLIAKVANGESLNREDARTAFDILMSVKPRRRRSAVS